MVIFHSSLDYQASPAISGFWRVPPSSLLIQSRAVGGYGNDVNVVAAVFLSWCYSQAVEVAENLAVCNLPGISWSDDFVPKSWYTSIMNYLYSIEPKPFLVDLDRFCISQGGTLIWKLG